MAEGKKRGKLALLGASINTGIELLVTAEVLWWYLSDGEQTFHGQVKEWAGTLHNRLDRRTSVDDTLSMIRDLPETSD